MFPGANASVYYNEDGEVLGWDNDYGYEPPDYYPYMEDDCKEIDPEDCEHGDWSHMKDGTYRCDICLSETNVEENTGEVWADGSPIMDPVWGPWN